MDQFSDMRNRRTKLEFLVDGLIIYKNLKKNRVVNSLQNLLHALADSHSDPAYIYKCYHEFCGLAVENKWPDYLATLILDDENSFSINAAEFGPEGLCPELKALVVRDLSICQELSRIDFLQVIAVVKGIFGDENEVQGSYISPTQWPEWGVVSAAAAGCRDLMQGEADEPAIGFGMNEWSTPQKIAWHYLRGSESVEEFMEFLARYHKQMGYGQISRFLALQWQGKAKRPNPSLLGIAKPDIVRREQLIGLERELKIIAENTEFFLAGHAANNMILYGSRGTGKSSAIKVLLDIYAERGLRLVELDKGELSDFPVVVKHLAYRPQKFIIFVDDLSFDDTELEYKALKSVLEGGLEGKPGNVLIYATSNRRHLIKEKLSEREGDEVHAKDTQEEKLSLADRFGITVTFPSPDQEGYLKIVEGLAEQRGLHMQTDELRQLALRWEIMHNGRSGRTARQFVNYLEARLAIPGRG